MNHPNRFPSLGPVARRLATLAMLASLSMCNIDHIDVDAGAKATIPQGTLLDTVLGKLTFAGFDKVDFSADFANQGVTKDQVDSVKLKSFTVTIDAPASATFDFLDSVAFYAEADGEAKIRIASLDPVPSGKHELTLSLDADAELAPYVTAASMRISSEIQGKRPDQDTTVSAAVVLDVNVHIPGCN